MADLVFSRFGRRSLLGAAALAVLGGCTAPARAPLRTPTAPVGLAAALRDALAARDQAAFTACFTAGARTLGTAWFVTWTRLAEVDLTDADGAFAVTWRVGAEPESSRAELTLTLAGGLVDAVAAATPAPVWLRHACAVATNGPLGVLAATGEADPWLDAAGTAAARVGDAGASRWGWQGDLVVEVAADALEFRHRAAGADVGAAAAYTTRDPQPVVVVDGTAAQAWTAEDRAGLLTHEGVHAAQGTLRDRLPRWLGEGVAEWVTRPLWPAAAAADAAALAGLPAEVGLPADAEFTDPAAAAGAYARAELAVAGLVAAYGRDRVWDWLPAWAASGIDEHEATALLHAERARRG